MLRCYLVLIFLFFADSVSAQSSWSSFWKLSGPEKCWVLGHPFIASKARKLTIVADSTSRVLKENGILDGDNAGGQLDAFRHAYWMALLSQKFSWKKAVALGKAHEKGNYKQFKKGIHDEEFTLPDSVSGAMDIFNNEIGAQIGRNNNTTEKDSLTLLIRKEILEGKMRIILKNKKGDFIDCIGNIIDMKQHKSKWNVPKCLVKSDYERMD